MMPNMVPPQEQLPLDEITSPLGTQIFEFCESELFPETLQNTEAASSTSNCCNYEEHTFNQTPLSVTPPPALATSGGGAGAGGGCPSSPSTTAARNSNLAMLMGDQTVDDISASIDFTLSPSFSLHDQQYNNNHESFAAMNHKIQLNGEAEVDGSLYAPPQQYNPEQPQQPVVGPPFPVAMKEECMPSFNIRMRSSSPACTLSDPVIGSYLSSTSMTAPPFPFDTSWPFLTGGSGSGSGLVLGSDFSHQELESQGDNGGFFLPDSLARVFNCSSGDLQTLGSSEGQHMLNGSSSTALASEISSLEDPSFKVGKLSAEDKKLRIEKYLKKRHQRNFNKKIKYACRKTLADSRPRVRGRFAKNDELGELARNAGNNQDDDVDEDLNQMFPNPMPDHHHKAVKEEDDIDPSELFSHISAVNSYKCSNYPIKSWM